MTGQLHAVADAENRNIQLEDSRVATGGAWAIDTRRTTGENDAARIESFDPFGGQIVADNLAKDILLAHTARDKLAVLRAKIEDQHRFLVGRAIHCDNSSFGGMAAKRCALFPQFG